MKKISLIIFAFALIQISYGQNIAPQGTASNVADWTRGGNTGGMGSANIIGPSHYMPFYFRVGGTNLTTDIRMKMNPAFATSDQYGINGFTRATGVNTNGYVGIGANSKLNLWSTDRLWSNRGPFSMLHLNGGGTFVQELGYRPWMQTGITFTSNNDLAYIGHRSTSGLDATDLMFVWSDNGAGAVQDNLVFAFTTGDAASMGTNDLDGSSNFGREVMRMIPNGNIGVGPRFNNANNPKSQLHIHGNDNTATWMQISNQFVSTGTNNVADNDGFRFGINSIGQAHFLQQENQPIILYTDWDNTAGGITNGERIRVTTVGQPDVPNPSNVFPVNTTRVSISHNGANPIHQPRSLLHLGYNTGSFSNYGADGWRTWMDIGMFVTDGTDNVYLGLKRTAVTDRTDAVLSWGDNQPLQTPDGPDNLLFVFTATNSALVPSTGQAATVDGVEGMRMSPTQTSVNVGIGGNPGTNNYFNNSINPTQTLEVNSTATTVGPTNSGLRFTDLNSSATPLANNPSAGFLTVNNVGDVVYMAQNQQSGGSTGAENGCSVNFNNNVVFGNDVGSTNAQLIDTREIPMSKNDILFTERGKIAIGEHFTAGANLPIAKLDIHPEIDIPLALNVESNINFPIITNYVMSEFNNRTDITGEVVSIKLLSEGKADKRAVGINIDVENIPLTSYGLENVGIISRAVNGFNNTGGTFYASNDSEGTNTGISATGHSSYRFNYGGVFTAGNPSYYPNGYNGEQNIGVFAQSWGGQDSYGIFATATGGSNINLAGFFDGDVARTGNDNFSSDSILKKDITSISNALSIISNTHPCSFNFKTDEYSHIALPNGLQYGMIAQEVETFLPELVKTAVFPAKYDSTGAIITSSLEFKTLNYSGFIPILIQAVQEINTKNDSAILVLNNRVDSLENIIASFESRFDELSSQIDDCCKNSHGNGHGQGNNKSNSDDSQTYQPTVIQIDLEYSDAIILEQNVPNPFAEKTTINYTIPEEISFAQIIFSNNYGKIIKTVDITSSGQGSIVVYASNLSSGIYNYSLIIDGKIIETKKMVCTK